MFYDAVVVGAGLAGSTTARLLAESGSKVHIIERLKHIAGHCYDFHTGIGITVHKYGPHIFHTNSKEVWDFVNRFTNFKLYEHRVLCNVDQKLVQFPINANTIAQVFDMDIDPAAVKEFLQKQVESSQYSNPPRNFRDVIVSQVGEKLYEIFYKNYTIKQWDRDPAELSADVASRVPIRYDMDDRYFSDIYQGVPVFGYTTMIRRMLDHKNISISFAEDYFTIKDQVKANIIVFTGELDRYFDYQYGELEYRSLDLQFETIDSKYYQPVAVVNYPNDYNWTRITEFKHLTGEESYRTIICFEYPQKKGEPYYVVLTKDNLQKKRLYMKQVKRLEQERKCFFLGRLAEYKYYNMDQVIIAARQKVNSILS